MPKRKNSEVASDSSDSDDNDEYIIIPNSCYSGSSDSEDCSNDEWSNDNEIVFPNVTYKSVVESYTSEQKQLEPNHVYSWIDGEKIYHEDLNNNILLSDKVKKSISESTPVKLFELFFSSNIKHYIIETYENGLKISAEEFNIFVGILLLSSYNIRTNEKDYWSKDSKINSKIVSSAMNRDKFLLIKSKIKLSKANEENDFDKVWKVHKIINLFRENI